NDGNVDRSLWGRQHDLATPIRDGRACESHAGARGRSRREREAGAWDRVTPADDAAREESALRPIDQAGVGPRRDQMPALVDLSPVPHVPPDRALLELDRAHRVVL